MSESLEKQQSLLTLPNSLENFHSESMHTHIIMNEGISEHYSSVNSSPNFDTFRPEPRKVEIP